MRSWLIYALGSGWGHLNRAVALGRVAARQRSVKILTNSPYADRVAVYLQHCCRSGDNLKLQIIPAGSSVGATCDQVQNVLLHDLHNQYDCLIVDTFPRGLGGELVNILPQLNHIPRILVHRDLKPEYVRAKSVLPFVQQWYSAVLVPGEAEVPLAGLPGVVHTLPWLVCSADELPSLTEMRSHLRLEPNFNLASESTGLFKQPRTVVICAAGQPSELAFFGNLTHQLIHAFPTAAIRCLAPVCPPGCPVELWVSHYPGMEYLLAADVVVGGAGYNTVYECAALNLPLVAFAFPRLYDRQARRAYRNAYWVQKIEEAIATIHFLLEQSQPKSLFCQPIYQNGTVTAFARINQICLSGE